MKFFTAKFYFCKKLEYPMKKFLLIQTAFIGDVILATSMIEKLHQIYPDSQIDFLLRKGNQGILTDHPYLTHLWIWDKKKNKYSNLFRIIKTIRSENYDYVINLQRFMSSGLMTVFSKGKIKIGFDKNPLSRFFDKKIVHKIGDGRHEIERNHELIAAFTEDTPAKPRMYPTQNNYRSIEKYKTTDYICIAPTSVWFTKQFPDYKWIELIQSFQNQYRVYLLGAESDKEMCEYIMKKSNSEKVVNLAGKLSFLESAALMETARMNFVNDSAPLHIASSMNAPTTAIFCSTVPEFGFTPLSQNAKIVQVSEKLECRPCGLHGYRSCPVKHFKCASNITIQQLSL
jgi:lipopolysaccharide heptosyltransferase II